MTLAHIFLGTLIVLVPICLGLLYACASAGPRVEKQGTPMQTDRFWFLLAIVSLGVMLADHGEDFAFNHGILEVADATQH